MNGNICESIQFYQIKKSDNNMMHRDIMKNLRNKVEEDLVLMVDHLRIYLDHSLVKEIHLDLIIYLKTVDQDEEEVVLHLVLEEALILDNKELDLVDNSKDNNRICMVDIINISQNRKK